MLCGLLKPTSGTAHGRRHRRRPRSGRRQAAHRLHVAAVLALRAADRRSEHPVLRRHLRPRRRAARARGAASCSRWPASRARAHARRAISPAAGVSGSRSAARFSTSRRSSFSTSRPAASIRCRAASSGSSSISSSAAGVTVLVTTHYLDEAEHCHRLAIIHAGRLAALGIDRRAEARVRRTGRSSRCTSANPVEAMRLLDAMPEVEKTSVFGTAVHAVLKTGAARRGRRAERRALDGRGRRSAAVAPVQPSLEDVFLEVVGTGGAEACARRSPSPQGVPPDRARPADAA